MALLIQAARANFAALTVAATMFFPTSGDAQPTEQCPPPTHAFEPPCGNKNTQRLNDMIDRVGDSLFGGLFGAPKGAVATPPPEGWSKDPNERCAQMADRDPTLKNKAISDAGANLVYQAGGATVNNPRLGSVDSTLTRAPQERRAAFIADCLKREAGQP